MNKCDIGTGEQDALDAGQGASPGGSRRFLWDVSALHPMLLLFCGSVFPPTMRWITKFSAQLSCSAVSVVEQDYHYGSEIASAPESTPNSRRQGAMGRHGTRSRGQTRPSGGCWTSRVTSSGLPGFDWHAPVSFTSETSQLATRQKENFHPLSSTKHTVSFVSSETRLGQNGRAWYTVYRVWPQDRHVTPMSIVDSSTALADGCGPAWQQAGWHWGSPEHWLCQRAPAV